MEVLKNIGKFLLGAILKSIAIILGLAIIWLVICILVKNGFREGFIAFLGSKGTHLLLGWLYGAVVYGIIEGVKDGDLLQVVIGVLMFFAPVIILAISTPNPDIELYDSSGNLWKLRKG
jgi:hypothetical protein